MAEPAAAQCVLQAGLAHNAIGIPRERPGDVVERGETLGLLREAVKLRSQLHPLPGTRGQAVQPCEPGGQRPPRAGPRPRWSEAPVFRERRRPVLLADSALQSYSGQVR